MYQLPLKCTITFYRLNDYKTEREVMWRGLSWKNENYPALKKVREKIAKKKKKKKTERKMKEVLQNRISNQRTFAQLLLFLKYINSQPFTNFTCTWLFVKAVLVFQKWQAYFRRIRHPSKINVA